MSKANPRLLAAALLHASERFLAIARNLNAGELSPSDQIEAEQAETGAGATIWKAVIDGYISEPEIVALVEELRDIGHDEPDTQHDWHVCVNLLNDVMHAYYYLSESTAPYIHAALDARKNGDDSKLHASARAEHRQEWFDKSACCVMLAESLRNIPPPAPPDPFAEPRRIAKDMGPVSRKIVEEVCNRGGSIPLGELAKILEWDNASEDACFQARKTKINKEFKGTPWKLERKSKEARLTRIGKNPLNEN